MRPLTLTRDHLEAIRALVTQACPTRTTDEACLGRVLFAPPCVFVAQRVWGCWRGGALLGIVAACVDLASRGFVQLLAVAPKARRRGLGTTLLRRAEHWLHARGAPRVAIEGSAPAYWRPGIELTNRELCSFFVRRGYREVERRRSLRVELRGQQKNGEAGGASAPARDIPKGITVERYLLGAPFAPFAAIADAFGEVWATEAWLAASVGPAKPSGLLLARDEAGALLGFAASGVGGPDVFGPTGVWPAARGRGVGRRLLLRALDDIAERGCKTALISWLGPEGYYRRALSGVDLDLPVDLAVDRVDLAVEDYLVLAR
jgi:mycothiol synthase